MTTLESRDWVFIDAALERQLAALLPVLEGQLPLQLGGTSLRRCVASIVTSLDSPPADGGPTLVLALADARRACHSSRRIRFADDPQVPWPYCGRSLDVHVDLDTETQQSMLAAPAAVLATDDRGLPVWTRQVVGTSTVHRTAMKTPDAPAGADAGLAVGNERFVHALPLFDFLRGAAGSRALQGPALRASYIIDDPNLHWPTYGYADYRHIADSARRHRYHVAFATIPLDGWWVHVPTADIFRASPDALSLLIHGNNHARQELAQDLSPRECAALLGQAIARIEQLEAKARLPVSRVMVPPHGACSARMLAEMPRQGFESACISAGSLRAHNPGQAWTRSLGIAATEQVAGCPVLPRWAFAGTTDAILATAAYLGQPLVLRGHHQDLKTGLDVMERFASAINAFGDVAWGSLSDLSRRSYRHRIDASTLVVEPIANHVEVEIPAGIETLRVPGGASSWTAGDPNGHVREEGDLLVATRQARNVTLVRRAASVGAAPAQAASSTSTKLIVRRLLTETRDRLRVE